MGWGALDTFGSFLEKFRGCYDGEAFQINWGADASFGTDDDVGSVISVHENMGKVGTGRERRRLCLNIAHDW